MNPLLLILFLSAGVFALTGAKVLNAGNKSSIKLLNVDSLKVVGNEIVLTASVAIDNPTNTTYTVKQPYLKLLYNGSKIGNSLPNAKVYSIKGNERTTIKDLNLRIAFTSAPVLAMAILNKSQSAQTVILETSTSVNGIFIKDAKSFRISDLVALTKKDQ